MTSPARTVFPLVPRHRVTGLPFGGASSLRRGHGSDVAGSRAYVRGDPLSTIDWRASARLSTARGADEFVVRERYAEEAPRVVVFCDLSPSMALYPRELPWLEKRAVLATTSELIVHSAYAAKATVAYLDLAGASARHGAPFWVAPQGRGALERIEARHAEVEVFDAPEDGLARGLEFLARFRSELSSGTFVFVISDFLEASLSDSVMLAATARRWELVPVVVQDPGWEQSFPQLAGIVVALADPRSGASFEVRLSAREARARREHNERRHQELVSRFAALGLDPVLLDTAAPAAIERAFLDWAARRRDLKNRR